MELNISLAPLSDQQKSHEPSPCAVYLPHSPSRRSKAFFGVKLVQKSFFTTLITSYNWLAKTILFNCLISPSHYNIQYFVYGLLAAYRTQLSIDPS